MDDYYRSLQGRLDRRHLQTTIGVVGLGRVGGWSAVAIAKMGPRRLILADGDPYERGNVSGHQLPIEFVGENKALALADFITREVPDIEVVTIPYFVDGEVEDELILEDVIEPSRIVICATDDLDTQRRVAGLARQADVPAIVPGIAADLSGRGEAFLSFSQSEPCAWCWDGFRAAGAPVRGAAATMFDAAPAVHLTVSLALALLDPTSRETELLTPLREGGPVPQLFRAWPPGAPELAHADDGRAEVGWRPDCPGCGGRRPPVMTRRRLARQRQEQMDRNRLRWQVPRWLVWSIYLLEFLYLVISDASGGQVVGFMAASLALGFGYWIGRRIERVGEWIGRQSEWFVTRLG